MSAYLSIFSTIVVVVELLAAGICMYLRPTWRNGGMLCLATAQAGAFLLLSRSMLGEQLRIGISVTMLLAIAINMHFLNKELTAARHRAQHVSTDSLRSISRRNGTHGL